MLPRWFGFAVPWLLEQPPLFRNGMGCPWMVHPNSVMRLSTILRPKLLTTTSWCVYKVLAMLNHCWSERRLTFNNHLYPNSTFTSRLEAFQNQSYLRSRPRPVEGTMISAKVGRLATPLLAYTLRSIIQTRADQCNRYQPVPRVDLEGGNARCGWCPSI